MDENELNEQLYAGVREREAMVEQQRLEIEKKRLEIEQLNLEIRNLKSDVNEIEIGINKLPRERMPMVVGNFLGFMDLFRCDPLS